MELAPEPGAGIKKLGGIKEPAPGWGGILRLAIEGGGIKEPALD